MSRNEREIEFSIFIAVCVEMSPSGLRRIVSREKRQLDEQHSVGACGITEDNFDIFPTNTLPSSKSS